MKSNGFIACARQWEDVGKQEHGTQFSQFQPTTKKAKVSTSSSGTSLKAPVTDEEMAIYCKGYIPQNTQ